ncbi:T-complex protein 1 subunit theta [Nowakowskiella sp. JEL0407]|nr:T-complex protein 1 subunit theta [Nowakowskiella sp. JEL0407]
MQGLEEAVFRNIAATKDLQRITKTSYGPNGRNKMVINHLEKLFVTSDAATIMKELEVVHPAGKLLVMASQQQEQEMGDNTNFVIVFAGELLQQAEYLLRMGLVPADVIQGYDIAGKKALEFLNAKLDPVTGEALPSSQRSWVIPTGVAQLSVHKITQITAAELTKAVKPAIASKQYGYEDLLTNVVVEASLQVMPTNNPSGFNVDSVRVVKILGGSVLDTKVVKGMVFGREAEGVVTKATKAQVAIYSCALDIQTTETKGTVLIKSAEEMVNFSKGEESNLEKVIRDIADSGVKVVVAGSGVGELALHFANRCGIMVVKILSKFDLRRLSRVIGATVMTRLGAPTKEEVGYCDVVETTEIGSDRCTVFRQEGDMSKTATIVIRGGTSNMLDDLERAVDDGVNVVKAVVRDGRLVAGAGAIEVELAKRLSAFGEKTPGLNQYAIKKFAESLEVVPRTLAENAGMDSTEVLSKLYAAHQQGKESAGVDIESEDNGILDAKDEQIFDSLGVKYWALKLATNAALTVLSVDQIIMSKPAGGPKPKEQKGNWDEDD